MNKNPVIRKIVEQLTADLELLFKAARAAHGEATHEQSKSESKYDTRGLEAAYLARGQSRQAAELSTALKQFQAIVPRTYAATDPIDLGALVELERSGERTLYFVGPAAGGTEISHLKKNILVITPASPLGRELMGRKKGERLALELGGSRDQYEITSVW